MIIYITKDYFYKNTCNIESLEMNQRSARKCPVGHASLKVVLIIASIIGKNQKKNQKEMKDWWF